MEDTCSVAGITSACAEQTAVRGRRCRRSWDHLRVCGADVVPSAMAVTASGSPPRVRSRRSVSGRAVTPRWDHLRVCGADTGLDMMLPAPEGSPPRVRSRLIGFNPSIIASRITSACAEQTPEARNA